MSSTAVLAPLSRPASLRLAGSATRSSGRAGSSWRTAARAPCAPSHGVRLTRRGRAVVVAVLVALLLAAFSLGRVGAEGSTSTARPATQVVTVAPGDTLWGVASRLAPGQDPRPVVEQIRQLNDLESGALTAGQQLVLPGRAG